MATISKRALVFLIALLIVLGIGKFCEVKHQKKPTLIMVEIEVREGWCLSKIAQDLGTDWQEIAKLNNLKNPHLIYPGQKLMVIPSNSK